jgi:hypothetical protein
MAATGVERPSACIEDVQVGLHTNYANHERLLNPASGSYSLIGAPNIPLLAVRGWLCIRCLARTPDLKACGACHRVRYCSEQCQRVDWKSVHKQHCKAFRHVNLMEDEPFAHEQPGSWGPFCDWLVRIFRTRDPREAEDEGLSTWPATLIPPPFAECTHERTGPDHRQNCVFDLW